ncbi:hypothetical protein NFI96_030644, partial [Prochilodus magdalenae]
FDFAFKDKQVEAGKDVTLRCEANIDVTEVTAKWEKNGDRLQCEVDKHEKRHSGKTFALTIKNAESKDEGRYTLTLTNSAGSVSCSAVVTVGNRTPSLKNFTISKVRQLQFLLHGPVGAGKSSTINTIKSIFEGHQFINCLAAADSNGESFTKTFQPKASISKDDEHYISNPTLNDQIHCLISVIPADKITLMGDEVIQKMKAIRTEASDLKIPQLVFLTRVDLACQMTKKDLTKIYQSKKIKEKMQQCLARLGVPMNCIFPVMNYHEGNQEDNGPEIFFEDKFVCVLADKQVKLGDIPQLVFLTRVDKACQMVQKDVTKVYKSKRVKDKMQDCSIRLGVPMNCIFPIKSYHEETKTDNNLNCLMLDAMTQAVHSANDFVRTISTRRDSETIAHLPLHSGDRTVPTGWCPQMALHGDDGGYKYLQIFSPQHSQNKKLDAKSTVSQTTWIDSLQLQTTAISPGISLPSLLPPSTMLQAHVPQRINATGPSASDDTVAGLSASKNIAANPPAPENIPVGLPAPEDYAACLQAWGGA